MFQKSKLILTLTHISRFVTGLMVCSRFVKRCVVILTDSAITMWNNKLKKGALHVWPCLLLWNNNHSTKHIGLSEQPVLVFTWRWWTTANVVAELKGLKKCLVQSLGHCLICSSKYLTLNFHQGLPDLLWCLLLTPWVNSICWRTCKADEEAMSSLVSFTCWPGLHAAHGMHQIKDKGCE